ncbi:hypothetical protein [Candidatus Sororendozoicomonas aggregata]|uniref:hypothetical protein n=1 Tax=Candidatus Sororendozoicomonas aggregata TaxID=3073239 RepID=UPI002ED2307B
MPADAMGFVSSATDDTQQGAVISIQPDLRDRLKNELGLNDNQLDAWLAMGSSKESGYIASPADFDITNKETLNALEKSGQLSHLAQEVVATQAPVAMVSEVSNPSNWQQDQYIGPGAMSVSAFMQPAPQALPIGNLEPPLDPNTVSLDALVMSVLTERAEIIEVQLREQIGSIQLKNAELEVANGWLTRAKAAKTNAGTSDTSSFSATHTYKNAQGVEVTESFADYWASLGADSQSGTDHNSADWDVNISGLKAKIEALTSQSQLETTKLQQTINKYNQSFEMLSNFINKYYQSISTIIQNLR